MKRKSCCRPPLVGLGNSSTNQQQVEKNEEEELLPAASRRPPLVELCMLSSLDLREGYGR
jgi:hypothetical protein